MRGMNYLSKLWWAFGVWTEKVNFRVDWGEEGEDGYRKHLNFKWIRGGDLYWIEWTELHISISEKQFCWKPCRACKAGQIWGWLSLRPADRQLSPPEKYGRPSFQPGWPEHDQLEHVGPNFLTISFFLRMKDVYKHLNRPMQNIFVQLPYFLVIFFSFWPKYLQTQIQIQAHPQREGTAKVCANSGEVPINTRRSHEPVNGCPAKWV